MILFVKTKCFGLLGKFIEGSMPGFTQALTIGEHVPHPYAAMAANPPKRQLARFQKLDQVGPGDPEEIGGLLGGEFGFKR